MTYTYSQCLSLAWLVRVAHQTGLCYDQEQEYQRRQLMARYQSATPLEQERIRQQLMAQQQGFMPGLSSAMPGSPSMGGLDPQVGRAC